MKRRTCYLKLKLLKTRLIWHIATKTYGATLEKYDETFAPIATLTDSILVTKKSFYDGQEIAFFKVNLNNKKSGVLLYLMLTFFRQTFKFMMALFIINSLMSVKLTDKIAEVYTK